MINYNPKSHPDKLLIDHKKGILSLADITDLLLLAVFFHDVGKMNDNFQKYIIGEAYSGYKNHAHISAYYLIKGFDNNRETIMKRFPFITKDNFELILLVLVNIVIGHHGYLRNIDELFSVEERDGLSEWDKMIAYLKTIKMTEHVNTFFKDNSELLGCDLVFIDDIEKCDYYHYFGRIHDKEKWKKDALKYYFDTIMTFAELVNGDRRDASGNKMSYRNETKNRCAYSLENNLEWVFNSLRSETELNKMRNKIRKMAISKLQYYLKCNKDNKDNRVLTLTAPTGCGKTYIMLQLAVEILKENNYQHDIIYSLPYLSIIDQTTKILNNNLKIETLNYTSASDTSIKLQSMMEEGGSKELIEYAFSENCFDHSFVVTTFNQLFETFLNNSTSKLMRLKNFKKRIFLIDEFQAASPSQYYTLINILNEFCMQYDSYAIISTATMPCFGINLNSFENRKVKNLFKKQFYPKELLPDEIFDYDVFNRYRINFMGEVNPNSLYTLVNQSNKSALLILNTIKTSQRMYSMFIRDSGFEKVYILNAHLSPADRHKLLNEIFIDLKQNIKILVVSTQVIEAGVDISFPIVYRDAAPPFSVVQASGRCNRNGEFGISDVYLFLYLDPERKGMYDCNMVYYGTMTNNFRDDIKNKIPAMTEGEFHKRCQKYSVGLAINSEHGKVNNNQNIIEDMLNGKFKEIGGYRFIQGDPDAHTIYVGKDNKLWNEYINAFERIKSTKGYEDRDIANIEFKRIRGIILQNTINIRTKVFDTINIDESYGINKLESNVFGVFKLLDEDKYDSRTGLIEFEVQYKSIAKNNNGGIITINSKNHINSTKTELKKKSFFSKILSFFIKLK